MTTTFADQLGFPEAPVVLPDGGFLFVEMNPDRGWVIRFSKDGKSRSVLAKTGRPNGLAPDREGFVWVAETAMRALLRMSLDGKYEVIANGCDGQPFRFLNDLALAPNGDVYLTDSGIEIEEFAPGGQLNPDWRTLRYDGRVFRIDARTRAVECVDRGLQFTNGIAFGPDGNLYVAETLSGNIYRYEYREDRASGKRRLFGNVVDPSNPAEMQGAGRNEVRCRRQAFTWRSSGRATSPCSIPAGQVVKRMKTAGSMPTNLVFGPEGERKIYVTEVETGSVQVFDVETAGLPLNL